MKAIILKDFGSVDELVYEEIETPQIKDDEVLIKVKAIGINPVDAKTRKGKGQASRIKHDKPMILGWDVSGEVVDAGRNVSSFKAGDEVFGMINIPGHGRAYAEYVAAPANQLAAKPSNVSFEEAAAAGIAAVTALQALQTHGNVKAGQRVLIHAASGGVGHYAVQIAKSLRAYIIGSSSEANRDFVLNLGANEHMNYKVPDWEKSFGPVDFVLEAIGGDNIDRSLKLLKPGGTIVSLPSGLSENVGDKAKVQGKNGVFFTVSSNGDDMQKIAGMLASGALRSHISKTFPFSQIKEAHIQIESGKTRGKLVVLV
jgi:NADPH:quinone reductase-like Zn-dependent oxidoreductase